MLALVALSARRLAGWAAADGAPAIALDAFGDEDTRRQAACWYDVGAAGTARLDDGRLLDRMRALVRAGEVSAWVAGSGLEGRPDLVGRLCGLAPLLGTGAAGFARLADASGFFATLAALGIAHPPVRFDPPPSGGWLRKRTDGAGGWGIDRMREPAPGAYWQSERAATPISATYLANGERAVLLGVNRQQVAEIGPHPFVFAGIVGPVAVPAAVRSAIVSVLDRLVPAFGLQGLGSVDFVLGADGCPECLEVNPRPSASAALYPVLDGASPLAAHLSACRSGRLTAAPLHDRVRGLRIVFARRALRLDDRAAALVAATPGAGDLPRAGTSFRPGQPLCTLDAEGPEAAVVEAVLAARAAELLNRLENA